MSSTNLKCCCGRTDCAYLHHNNLALSGLEKDVETAARLGQALLDRHETYMAESERERHQMTATIEDLSQSKRQLEEENARIVTENRELLDQLEGLNNTITDSDAQIKSLNATLMAAQMEVRRLASLAARTSELEAQLQELEFEQIRLQHELTMSQEDEISAISRWRQADLTIQNLNDQIERIEKEARDERERHVELMGRMEKRRIVDSELKGAAGRLKGAAAAASLEQNKTGTSVVSHFVRDILQDNANLQAGIVELRELLQASNDEVQNLRDQIMLHQPLGSSFQGPVGDLNEEMEQSERRASQEVHVHHHYHTPKKSTPRKERVPLQFRGKRQRGSIASLASLTTTRSPNSPASERPLSYSPATYIQSPNPRASQRWSVQSSSTACSTAAMSALSSSPVSLYQPSSIFDRVETDYDSSRPTSPESVGFASPYFMKGHRKEISDFSLRSVADTPIRRADGKRSSSLSPGITYGSEPHCEAEAVIDVTCNSTPVADETVEASLIRIPAPLKAHTDPLVIPEDPEGENASNHLEATGVCEGSQETTGPESQTTEAPTYMSLPRHQRSSSRESLLSISGMDIHTLKERPSQMLLANVSIPFATTALTSSSGPVISTTEAHASSTPSLSINEDHFSSQKILSGFARSGRTPPSHAAVERAGGLSRLVGGWNWGKWGMAPTPPSATKPSSNTGSTTSSQVTGPPSTVRAVQKQSDASGIGTGPRMPGINQKGPIMGFRPVARPPISIHPVEVDQTLLAESLAD